MSNKIVVMKLRLEVPDDISQLHIGGEVIRLMTWIGSYPGRMAPSPEAPSPEAPSPELSRLELSFSRAQLQAIQINPFGDLVWYPGDVTSLSQAFGPVMTDTAAKTFLEVNESRLRSGLIEAGQELISDFLREAREQDDDYGDDDDEDDDDEDDESEVASGSESFKVPAEVHSDDFISRARFDAAPWFATALPDQIRALAREGWGSGHTADSVAQLARDHYPAVEAVFEYVQRVADLPSHKDLRGYECTVDEDAARAWLKVHRPSLFQELSGE